MIRMGYRNTLLAGMVLLLSSCSGEDPRMEQHPLPEMEFVYPESIEEVDSLLAILPRGQDLEELHSLSRAFHARYVFSRECSDLDSALSYGELAVTLSEGGMRYDVTNPESMKDIRKVIICAHAGRREFERAFNKLRRTYRIHPDIPLDDEFRDVTHFIYEEYSIVLRRIIRTGNPDEARDAAYELARMSHSLTHSVAAHDHIMKALELAPGWVKGIELCGLIKVELARTLHGENVKHGIGPESRFGKEPGILLDEAIRMMAEAEDSLSADGYRYLSLAHSIRADMMEDDRDREDALDTVARGLEKFPQDPRLNYRKGMALHAMGRDGAEHCFRRALELDPLEHDFRQVFDR